MKPGLLLIFLLSGLCLSVPPAYAEKTKNSQQQEIYPLTLYDTRLDYFSMRQADELAVDIMLFSSDRAKDTLDQYTDKTWANILLDGVLGLTYVSTVEVWSHEEGHRSILTNHGISSRNSWIDGEVDHVSTQTLHDFKKNNYVDFIRLHTAGIESDAMEISDFEERLVFGHNRDSSVYVPLWTLKLINFGYIFDKSKGDGVHEPGYDELVQENELDRDIVGHDVYGFVRHLFTRNDISYQRRYSNRDLFSAEEKRYHKKVRRRAWLNFLDSNLFRWWFQWDIAGYDTSVGFNYYLSPFGDVTDLNILAASAKNRGKITIRQMRNHERNFYGLQLKDYRRPLGDKFWLTSSINLWQNPENSDFFSRKSIFGWAAEFKLEYALNRWVNISAGLLSKSKGFLPGINDNNLHSLTSASIGIVLKY